MKFKMETKFVVVSGKRKSAVARVKIKEGRGKIFYNGLSYNDLRYLHRLALTEPMRICESVIGNFNFDADIKTFGGGKEGQIQAARLGLAKALVKTTNSADLRKALLAYDKHLLVADIRRKEAYKPDDSKARAKRQTSYR